MNHLDKFNRAWKKPNFITIELDPIDVNKVLRERYKCTPEFKMTKNQLWDMEVTKASRPDLFIPSVIKSNSAFSWKHITKNNIETFFRVSEQRLWLDAERYGAVIENVHLDSDSKVVTFIGELEANSKQVNFCATKQQPIFHVQHGVIGDEEQPLNTWRIVLLTAENEQELRARFKQMNESKWLPEYIEIYIRNILGIQLERVNDKFRQLKNLCD